MEKDVFYEGITRSTKGDIAIVIGDQNTKVRQTWYWWHGNEGRFVDFCTTLSPLVVHCSSADVTISSVGF